MNRVAIASMVTLLWATVAHAQGPSLTSSTLVVPAGSSAVLTVTGTAGQFYAVISSASNSGFSYAGVNLAVGADVAIVATGVLDGAGRANVTVTPPFQGSLSRLYVQAVTSAAPDFVPLAASASVVLRNGDIAGPLPVGLTMNPNGSLQFASAGVTAFRRSAGSYRINFAPGTLISSYLPSVTVIGGQRVVGLGWSIAGIDVILDADALFTVTLIPVRP